MGQQDLMDRDHAAYAGQASYTPVRLRVYDLLVYRFNMPMLWRCPKDRLLRHYDEHVSARHLDVGVATGVLLDGCRFPVPAPEITLMDLNSNSLRFASQRLSRFAPRIHRANVLEDWGLPAKSFDSIGMTNLLHCLPGSIPAKAVAFDHASAVLAPGGVLFGATILGKGVSHPPYAKLVMSRLNSTGTFGNSHDDAKDLEAALGERFVDHRVDICGAMGLFVARVPV